CCDHHRDLHSFPTRRSSDLFAAVSPSCGSPAVRKIRCCDWVRHKRKCVQSLGGEDGHQLPRNMDLFERIAAISRSARRSGRSERSEEHTSELQSPYDLVCRL